MFTTVEQVKTIISNYLASNGQGGFTTGTVQSTSPLVIQGGQRLEIKTDHLYITDSCIGLTLALPDGKVVLREPLKKGDGVLLLSRPASGGNTKYILLDRIQPYQDSREVTWP